MSCHSLFPAYYSLWFSLRPSHLFASLSVCPSLFRLCNLSVISLFCHCLTLFLFAPLGFFFFQRPTKQAEQQQQQLISFPSMLRALLSITWAYSLSNISTSLKQGRYMCTHLLYNRCRHIIRILKYFTNLQQLEIMFFFSWISTDVTMG